MLNFGASKPRVKGGPPWIRTSQTGTSNSQVSLVRGQLPLVIDERTSVKAQPVY